METVKRLIMLHVPTSICNLRCHYCYLSQRDVSFQGLQANMQYTPEEVARALSPQRLGGICFINSCAEGETLLTKDIDKYYKALAETGHFIEIVTNMTVSPMIDRILSWPVELLKHIEFKCSFHYLELKKRKLLDVFAENVKKAWDAGASATIEVVPSDELIPYIPELKEFSVLNFGALPHLTIARDDRTKEIKKLTALSETDYKKTWKGFDSGFWKYKERIFGVRQKEFCYAGMWSITVDLATGIARKCYFQTVGNIFDEPDKPLPLVPIGQCPIAHCYNGHAFLTFGLIPHSTNIRYGDIRNRIRTDGKEWLQPELKAFFNTRLSDSNVVWPRKDRVSFVNKLNLSPKVTLRNKLMNSRLFRKLYEWKRKQV